MTTTALTTEKANSLRALLDTNKAHIARAMPRHLNADRMLAVATTAVQKTPALLNCDQASFVGAIIQCAQLGLEPNDGTGRAWLIPFGSQVQFIAGYRGLVDLTRRSGEIKRFDARAVYEGDVFSFAYGLRPELNHVPGGERKKLTHVYAVAEFKDGSTQFDVMTADDVEKIRNRSKAKNSGPWQTDYEEMAKKCIVRRLCKMLPVSPEAQKAVSLDERAELGLAQDLHLLADPDGKPTPEAPVYAMPKAKQPEAPKAEPVAEDEVMDETEPPLEPEASAEAKPGIVFTPADFSEKTGEKNGKPWTKFGVKTPEGDWIGTFDKTLGANLKAAFEQKVAVRVIVKTDGKFKTAESAELA